MILMIDGDIESRQYCADRLGICYEEYRILQACDAEKQNLLEETKR